MSIESLIQAHIEALTANTAAVNLLTESLYGRALPKEEKPAAAKVEKPKAKGLKFIKDVVEDDPEPITEEDVKVAEVDVIPGVAFGTVRELVLKLSSGHRDAIKAINQKHGIARLSALLKDENDFASVIDQSKLEAVHSDLQALEA